MITNYIPFISAIFLAGLAIFSLFKNPRNKLNFILFLTCFSLVIWLFATFKLFSSTTEGEAIFWDRVVYAGIVFFPTFVYHFALILSEKRRKIILLFGYILSGFFLVISRTDLFVKDLFYYEWGVHTKAQFFHHIFLIFFSSYILAAFLEVYFFQRSVESLIKKVQLRYVLVALILLVSIGSWAYLPAYGIGIYPFSYISGVVFSSLVFYAIFRYRFLDLSLILRRSLIYAISLGFSLLVLGYIYALFRETFRIYLEPSIWIQIISLGIFFFMFDRLRFFSTKLIDTFFPCCDIDIINFFSKVEKQTENLKQIDKKLPIFAREISSSFEVDFCGILLQDLKSGIHKESFWPEKSYLTKQQYDLLFQWFHTQRKIILVEELVFSQDTVERYKKLKKWDISVVMILHRADMYQGIIVLGNRQDEKIWTQEKIHRLIQFRDNIEKALGSIILYDYAMEGLQARAEKMKKADVKVEGVDS